jgi:hypothetical protein
MHRGVQTDRRGRPDCRPGTRSDERHDEQPFRSCLVPYALNRGSAASTAARSEQFSLNVSTALPCCRRVTTPGVGQSFSVTEVAKPWTPLCGKKLTENASRVSTHPEGPVLAKVLSALRIAIAWRPLARTVTGSEEASAVTRPYPVTSITPATGHQQPDPGEAVTEQ